MIGLNVDDIPVMLYRLIIFPPCAEFIGQIIDGFSHVWLKQQRFPIAVKRFMFPVRLLEDLSKVNMECRNGAVQRYGGSYHLFSFGVVSFLVGNHPQKMQGISISGDLFENTTVNCLCFRESACIMRINCPLKEA